MLYFILWAIFLLAVIVSVPVVHWLENKRRRESLAAEQPESDEEISEESLEEEVVEEEEPVEVGSDEFADDFSAFEDEFK